MTSTSATSPATNTASLAAHVIYPSLGVCTQRRMANSNMLMLESVSGRGAAEVAIDSDQIIHLPSKSEIGVLHYLAYNAPLALTVEQLSDTDKQIQMGELLLGNTPRGLASVLRDTRVVGPLQAANSKIGEKYQRALDRLAEVFAYSLDIPLVKARVMLLSKPSRTVAKPKLPPAEAPSEKKPIEEPVIGSRPQAARAAAAQGSHKAGRQPAILGGAPKADKPTKKVATTRHITGVVSPKAKGNAHPKYSPELLKEGARALVNDAGICYVHGVFSETVAGIAFEAVSMRSESTRMTISIPVAKAPQRLRAMPDKEEIAQAVKVLGGNSKRPAKMFARWAPEFTAKIKTYDPISVAEVLRDLRSDISSPGLSYGIREIIDQALDTMSQLYAVAHKVTRDDAMDAVMKAGRFSFYQVNTKVEGTSPHDKPGDSPSPPAKTRRMKAEAAPRLEGQ